MKIPPDFCIAIKTDYEGHEPYREEINPHGLFAKAISLMQRFRINKLFILKGKQEYVITYTGS
jgi:hypothetical protein